MDADPSDWVSSIRAVEQAATDNSLVKTVTFWCSRMGQPHLYWKSGKWKFFHLLSAPYKLSLTCTLGEAIEDTNYPNTFPGIHAAWKPLACELHMQLWRKENLLHRQNWCVQNPSGEALCFYTETLSSKTMSMGWASLQRKKSSGPAVSLPVHISLPTSLSSKMTSP